MGRFLNRGRLFFMFKISETVNTAYSGSFLIFGPGLKT